MIQRLAHNPMSFGAKEAMSPREAYDSQMIKNSQTAQRQNNAITNAVIQMNNQIPMQGAGQKLDVIA